MKSTVFYLSTVLIWGTTWYAITLQLGVVPESVSVFYRFALAGLLLLAFCRLTARPLRYSAREHGFMAAQGVCLFATNYLLFYYSTGYLPSGLVAVLFSTVMIMNIFNGALFLGRRIERSVLIGALIGFIGLSLVFADEIATAWRTADTEATRVLVGISLGLVATYSASLGNILSARNQRAGLPVLQTNAWGMAYGSLAMLVWVLSSGAVFRYELTVTYTAALVYLAVVGSILAFGAYLSLVGRVGADRAAYATVVFPLVALAISSLFEDFVWTPWSLAGIALVLIGNLLVVDRRALAALPSRLSLRKRAS